jgi:type IV secretory pathway VirB3-like protein
MARWWVALVGLVVLVGIAAVAFVDYELIRADADAAQANAFNARVSCLYGSPAFRPPAFSPAERKRRHARCERLPGPLREADRVERRWDQRGPWYGFAAAAIFLPTAVMFVQSRRRRASSAMLDPALSRPWRIATIAVRFAVGIMIWAALVYLVVDRWDQLVEATGGSTHDCHYPENDCGVLGEFTAAHPLILLLLMLAGAGIPAAAVTRLLGRLFRSLEAERNGTRHLHFGDSPSALS